MENAALAADIAVSVTLDGPERLRRQAIRYKLQSQQPLLGSFSAAVKLGQGEDPSWPQVEVVWRILESRAPAGVLAFDRDTVSFRGILQSATIDKEKSELHVHLGKVSTMVTVSHHELAPAQRDCLLNLLQTARRISWEDVKERLGAAQGPSSRDRVFISYRKLSHLEQFAGAVADRLGIEGLRPWLDQWEVVAGDSLPGRIEEALEASFAFIPILSGSYTEGKWATAELESALSKRVAEGYRIVPVLFEDCKVPELLRPTVYVDCREHNEEAFQAQMRQLVEGVYRLTRSPYR